MKIGGSCASIALHLHRRGMGAQQHVLRARRMRRPRHRLSGTGRSGLDSQRGVEAFRIDVEGVLCHPRRVPGRVIEGGEVVVVELDLGTLHDPVAEADEHVLDLAHGPNQETAGADGTGVPGRVTSTLIGSQPLLELGRFELRAPVLEQPLQRLPRLVCGSTDRPTLLGRKLADAAQDPGQLRLASQVADPELFELGGVRGGGDRGFRLASKLLDPGLGISHGRASYVRAHTARPSRPSRR